MRTRLPRRAGTQALLLAVLASPAVAAPAAAPGPGSESRPGAAAAVVSAPVAAPEAQDEGGGPPPRSAAGGARHDAARVLPPADLARPGYLRAIAEPAFGTMVMRIGGDAGTPLGSVNGAWGPEARHTYSKQGPWSSDQSLLVLENRKGSPSPLFLDGQTYRPKLAPCPDANLWDYRWNPSLAHPHELINVDRSGTELSWYDVTTCRRTRHWHLPIKSDYGIGQGEGNPSADGRFVCVANARQMVVVDMDPQPPLRPWPAVRIGPVYSFPPCSLSVSDPDEGTLDNVSVSPSGRYVVVKYGTKTDTTEDMLRVYDVDPRTLALRPRAMSGSALRCGSFQGRPNGWIFPLKHPDLAVNPFDGNEDVIVGGRSCPGSNLGHVVLVRLRDGEVSSLTDPHNEAPVFHVSARNLRRPGWVYVSYYRAPGRRFSDEVVAVKLDGSGTVERWARLHSLTKGCYRCEPQPVPSPDGRRVLFASNWAVDCGGDCGSPQEVKDYVVWSPGERVSERLEPRSSRGASGRPARPPRRGRGRRR